MIRGILMVAAVALLATAGPAFADQVPPPDYGWEDCGTALGMYGTGDPPILATNVIDPDPVHGGLHSLRLVDNSPSGTPQVYVAWVTGLVDGDSVYSSLWRYDVTPDASPSCRLWAHWNDDPTDVDVYSGSAGGNSDYGPGTGWDYVSYTWHVVEGHTGLVIEVRTYSNPGDTTWIDDLRVWIPDTATLHIPIAGASATDPVTWTEVKSMYR